MAENERVRGELARQLDTRAAVAAASEVAPGADSALVLLREENELLRQVGGCGCESLVTCWFKQKIWLRGLTACRLL